MFREITRRTIKLSSWFFIGVISMVQSVAALEVGDMMPDFSLPASDGKTYTLSQFKGNKPVVIAFFPKAFTPG